MTTFLILAHHLEAHHVAIAAALFAAGSVGGWLGVARWQDAAANRQRLS